MGIADELEQVLTEWHAWQRGYRPVRSYNDRAQGCELHRSSRQYDDVNGALDEANRESQMRAVDYEISELPNEPRWCITEMAMHLARGHCLQRNPRLPRGPERAALDARSRVMLTRRLVRAGVLTSEAETV